MRKKHISKYIRKGKEVTDYYYTPRRKWIDAEMRFLVSRIGKDPKDVIGEYRASPLAFRTSVSVRNKFYRVRKQFERARRQGKSKSEFMALYR